MPTDLPLAVAVIFAVAFALLGWIWLKPWHQRKWPI
jgi:hypothetical protein